MTSPALSSTRIRSLYRGFLRELPPLVTHSRPTAHSAATTSSTSTLTPTATASVSPTSPPSSLHVWLRRRLEQSQHDTAGHSSPGNSSTTPTPASTLTAPMPTSATTIATAQPLVAIAGEALAYLRAQRTYLTLLERYNPGMGLNEQRRVQLTARRVGMQLPVEFDSNKIKREGDD